MPTRLIETIQLLAAEPPPQGAEKPAGRSNRCRALQLNHQASDPTDEKKQVADIAKSGTEGMSIDSLLLAQWFLLNRSKAERRMVPMPTQLPDSDRGGKQMVMLPPLQVAAVRWRRSCCRR
jgi:hypothetical protein